MKNRFTNQIRAALFGMFFIFVASGVKGQDWKQLGPWGGAVVSGLGGDSSMLIAKSENPVRFYGSYDGGDTWHMLKGYPTTGFADKLNKFGSKIYFSANGAGAYVSTDSCRTWINTQGNDANGMPGFELPDGKLICYSNLFFTEDGLTMQQDGNRKNAFNLFVIGNQLFGTNASDDSLFSSTDAGLSWTYKSKIGHGFYPSIGSVPQFGNPISLVIPSGAVFINTYGSPLGTGPLLRSLDGGLNWTTCNSGLPPTTSYSDPYTAIQNTLFTTNGNGIFRSADQGASWEGINTPVPSSAIRCLYTWKNRLLLGTDRGLYKSDNLGNDWVETGRGFQAESIRKVLVNENKLMALTTTYAGSYPHKYVSENGGVDWQFMGAHPVALSTTNYLGFNFGDTCLVSDATGYSYHVSYDFGSNWTAANPLSDPNFGANVYGLFGYNKALYFNRLGSSHYLMRSTNFGQTWDTASSDSYNTANMTFAGAGQNLYCFITPGPTSADRRFLRSQNNGVDWSSINLPSSFDNISVNAVVAKGDSLFLVTSDGTTPAFRSYNKGQTWSSLFQVGGASNSTLFRLLEYKGILYLASSNGIYRSSNWGNSWSAMIGNLPFNTGTDYSDMVIKGDSLIVAPIGHGLWYTSLCQATANALNLTPCAGGLVQLLASGGTSFSWTGPNGFNSPLQNPLIQNITVAGSGTYNVTVTTPGGCVIQKSVTITVQPGAGILTLTAPPICAGGTLQLGVTGGTGTYLWTGPGGFSSTLQNPHRDTVTAADSGLYTVTVTAANNCTSTKSIYVAVPYLPRANQVAIPNKNPCNRDTILLQASFLINGVQYQWYKNNVAIAGATNPTYKATTSGEYHFVYKKAACQSGFADTVGLTFSGFRKPQKPVINVFPQPTACNQSFVLQATATGNYMWSWYRNGVLLPDETNPSMSTNILGSYAMRVDTLGGCNNISAPLNISLASSSPFTEPDIHVATIRHIPGDTLRCAVEWKRIDPPNANIQRVIILRQNNIAGQFDSIGTAGNGLNDTAFVDIQSEPWTKPYFYKIQARAVCPSGGTYLTSPSSYHKTIHMQISKAPFGNVFNLLWTAYQGFNVISYTIYRGLSPSTTSLLTTVAGNITAYTDVPPTGDVYFYRVDAETADAYFPWGRINAVPRKSLSNTRPTTQRIPDSTSIENPVEVVNLVGSKAWFSIYPNPHNRNFYIKGGETGQTYKAILRDMIGREIGTWPLIGNQLLEIQPEISKGVYMLEIQQDGYRKVVRLLRE